MLTGDNFDIHPGNEHDSRFRNNNSYGLYHRVVLFCFLYLFAWCGYQRAAWQAIIPELVQRERRNAISSDIRLGRFSILPKQSVRPLVVVVSLVGPGSAFFLSMQFVLWRCSCPEKRWRRVLRALFLRNASLVPCEQDCDISVTPPGASGSNPYPHLFSFYLCYLGFSPLSFLRISSIKFCNVGYQRVLLGFFRERCSCRTYLIPLCKSRFSLNKLWQEPRYLWQ